MWARQQWNQREGDAETVNTTLICTMLLGTSPPENTNLPGCHVYLMTSSTGLKQVGRPSVLSFFITYLFQVSDPWNTETRKLAFSGGGQQSQPTGFSYDRFPLNGKQGAESFCRSNLYSKKQASCQENYVAIADSPFENICSLAVMLLLWLWTANSKV